MQAVVFHEHGDVDVLKEVDVPKPTALAGTVSVRVRACAMNHLDIWVRKGWPGLELQMPHALGSDIAGEIAEVGAGVDGVSVGDEVIVQPVLSCGRCAACAEGFENRCRQWALMGEQVGGGYRQYLRVPARNVVPKPAKLSFEEAACIPVTFMTAWHMLVRRCDLRPGATVLVHAAGSGVGVAAIQIAKLHGATVLTTASTEEKRNLGLELGADHAIDYTQGGFRSAAKDFLKTRGHSGVDIVFEHTGAATFPESLRCLNTGGTVITCGATSGPKTEVDLRHLFWKHQNILGSTMGSRSDLLALLRHFEQGTLRAVIDRTLPLEEAAEGHRALQSRAQFGKIVLSPRSEG